MLALTSTQENLWWGAVIGGFVVVLAVVGVLLLGAAALMLPESRVPGPPSDLRPLVRDRRFAALTLCSGLMMAAMFA